MNLMKKLKKKRLIKLKKKKPFKKNGVSKSGFEPLTDGFSIQYSTPELLRHKNLNSFYKEEKQQLIN